MSTSQPAKVGDVIEHGQDIPGNVVHLACVDRYDQKLTLTRVVEGGHDGARYWTAGRMETWDGVNIPIPQHLFPLTVVEVDPEQRAYPLRCPTCGSPQPSMHPAVGGGGEVTRLCADPFHGPQSAVPQGPVTLSLPVVPDGAVALVDRHQRRWVPADMKAEADRDSNQMWRSESDGFRTYGALLIGSGPLGVEFAPPREPRTWEQLDAETNLPDEVDVIDSNGNVTRWTRPAHEFSWYSAEGMEDRPFIALRTLGKVREVLG